MTESSCYSPSTGTIWLLSSSEKACDNLAALDDQLVDDSGVADFNLLLSLNPLLNMAGLILFSTRKGAPSKLTRQHVLSALALGTSAVSAHTFTLMRTAAVPSCSHSLRLLITLSRVLLASTMINRAYELRPNTSRALEYGAIYAVAAASCFLVLLDMTPLVDMSAACTGTSWTSSTWLVFTYTLQPLLLIGCAVRAILAIYENPTGSAAATDEEDSHVGEHYNRFAAHSLFTAVLLNWFCATVFVMSDLNTSVSAIPFALLEVCASPAILLFGHSYVETSSLFAASAKASASAAKGVSRPGSNPGSPNKPVHQLVFQSEQALQNKQRLRLHRRTPSAADDLPTVNIDRSAFLHEPNAASATRQKPRHMRLTSVDRNSLSISAQTASGRISRTSSVSDLGAI